MTLKTARGTLALLALEDAAPDVLFERLPGATVALWPDVRSRFMSAMQDHDFGSVPAPTASSSRVHAWMRLARSLLPSRWDARQLREERSALYVVGGGTVHGFGSKLRNWLIGDFADEFPDHSVILQWQEIGPRKPAFPLTRSLDPLVTRAAGYARLPGRYVDSRRVRKLVREFANQLDARISDEQIDAIAASATYSASLASHVEAQFSRVLDRVQPRVALMEDASYGGRAALVALMKARGILVAEPQHGWIGPTHGAYNFGAAMRVPELFATLPDELLTFGDYWSEGIRHPARSVAIGKPHLEAMVDRAVDRSERPLSLLLVSSVTDPEETNDFGLALRSALPTAWTVIFRPHPSERVNIESRYGRMLSHSGIMLDENSDVYESLSTVRGVVGVASTVLFEALAMGCHVFVRDSPYAEYYVGDVFGPTIHGAPDIARVARVLLEDNAGPAAGIADAMWKPHALENFRKWTEASVGT